jgi:hypothetical protein
MQILSPHSPRNNHFMQAEDTAPLTGKPIHMNLLTAVLSFDIFCVLFWKQN